MTADEERALYQRLLREATSQADVEKQNLAGAEERLRTAETTRGDWNRQRDALGTALLNGAPMSDADREEAQKFRLSLVQSGNTIYGPNDPTSAMKDEELLYRKRYMGGNLSGALPNLTQRNIDEVNIREGLLSEATSKLDAQRLKTRESVLGAKEAELRLGLFEGRTAAEQAIDLELLRQLEETGISGRQTRIKTGEQIAERGLSRSSVGAEAVNDVYKMELEARARQRLDADIMKADIKRAERNAINRIEEAKVSKEYEKGLIEAQARLQSDFETKQLSMQNRFQEMAVNKQISAKESAQSKALIQGVFATGGAIAGSYFGPVGTVAGGAIGSTVGAMAADQLVG